MGIGDRPFLTLNPVQSNPIQFKVFFEGGWEAKRLAQNRKVVSILNSQIHTLSHTYNLPLYSKINSDSILPSFTTANSTP